jgi:hypothetical protein
MKPIISNKKIAKGIYQLPCTGSKSTDFSGAHVSYSDIDRLKMDMDLLEDEEDLPFFDDVPISPVISSSSPSSSSFAVDCTTPAIGFS